MRTEEKKWARFFVPIFFLSGAAGLGYQVIWAKAFAAAIGHEFPAVLAVVTAFMGGMAAGNALIARKAVVDPRWYGWLEFVIGIWAVATIFLGPVLQRLVSAILGVNPSAVLHWSVVFLVVAAALFPATLAMGATFPAAERFFFARTQRRATGLLYSANTAGAVAGALISAFWLMPAMGLRGSIFVFAAVNVACGFAALALARNTGLPATNSVAGRIPRSLAVQLFLIGFLGIGFEVVIVRGLAHVLENTVYTFAVVLAVYLAGNAIGAGFYQRAQASRIFGNAFPTFAALSAACLLAGIALPWSPQLYAWLRFNLGDSLLNVAAAETMTATALFFVPAVFMGATWAWLAQSSLRHAPNLGWGVAINTAGAALAPLFFGLFVIPTVGLRGALAIIPIGYTLLAVKQRWTGIALLVVACAIPLLPSSLQLIDTTGAKIISLKEGVMGSVAVLENAGARVLKFNNRFQMGGTAARIAEERQADIPLLLHPDPKRALFIGLGTGITFATAAHYPGLRADGVELVPEIAGAMPLFDQNDSLRSPNLRVQIADGRRFVRAAKDQFDVIVADLFHPAHDGAGFLYTREHFAAIRERLNEGGLFCQWLPLHQMDLETFQTIQQTFRTAFPDSQCWLLRFNIDTPVIGLVGGKNFDGYRTGIVEKRMAEQPGLAAHLRAVGLTDSVRLFGCYLGEARTDRSQSKVNTDFNPVVIFRAPAITFARDDDPGKRLIDLIGSLNGRVPTSPSDTELRARIETFIEARNVYLGGLLQESRGDLNSAISAFLRSAKASPDFTAGYAQALALATTLAQSKPDRAIAILEALIAAQPERPVARELLERLQK